MAKASTDMLGLRRRDLLVAAAGLSLSGPVRAEAVNPERLTAADGAILRPLGFVAPTAAREGRAALAIEEGGRTLAQDLLQGGWRAEGGQRDRWGDLRARVVLIDGRMLDEVIIAAGLAWAWPEDLPPAAAMGLFSLEEEARAARRGLWAVPALSELPASLRAPPAPRFAIVRGTVHDQGAGGDFLYLNFAADFRRDFTIRIQRRDRTAFRRAGLDPATLAGRTLRCRGWLFAQAGPMIEATLPFQLTLL